MRESRLAVAPRNNQHKEAESPRMYTSAHSFLRFRLAITYGKRRSENSSFCWFEKRTTSAIS
jgi:hypothetical protein